MEKLCLEIHTEKELLKYFKQAIHNYETIAIPSKKKYSSIEIFVPINFRDILLNLNISSKKKDKKNICIYNVTFDNITFHKKANFGGIVFLKNFFLRNVIFNDKVDFRCSIFSSTSNFRSVTFCQEAIFDSLEFYGNLYFKLTKFKKSVVFCATIFKKSVEFTSTTFNGSADFKYTTFNEIIDFNSVIFDKTVSFLEAVFYYHLNLSFIQFNESVDFRSTNFSGSINFIATRFNDHVDFSSACFGYYIDFSPVVFGGCTTFDCAVFKHYAIFCLKNINTYMSFKYAIFEYFVDFSYTVFTDVVDFSYTTFESLADFNYSVFHANVFFKSATFKYKADFSFAIFEKNIFFDFSIFNHNINFYLTRFLSDASFSNVTLSQLSKLFFCNLIMSEKTNLYFGFINNNSVTAGIITIKETVITGRVDLYNANIAEINLEKSYIIGEGVLSYTKDFIDRIKNWETACLFKNEEIKRNNIKQALKYKGLENEYFRKHLKEDTRIGGKSCKEKTLLYFERFSLWLSKISNNHGQNWGKALVYTLFSIFIPFSIFYAPQEFSSKIFAETFCNKEFYVDMLSYFNPTDYSVLEDYIRSDVFILTKVFGTILYMIGKISTAYGLFEIVQAFRKFNTKM